MQNFTKSIAIAVLCAAAVGGTSAQARTLDATIAEKLKGNPGFVTMPQHRQQGFAAPGCRSLVTPQAVTNEPSTIAPSSYWGTITGPDGNDWIYTQEFTRRGQWDFSSSTITIYNFENQQVGQVTVDVPEDEHCNDIQVFGYVTNNFFDRNTSTYEITVYINIVENNVIHGRIEAYSLDGEKVAECDGTGGLYYTHTANYSTWQRYLMIGYETVDGVDCVAVNVWAPASWQNDYTPTIEHTFYIPYDKLQYSEGPFANVYFIDDQPYFVISHYEKPYGDGTDPNNGFPIVASDNNYVVTAYDRDYNEVATVKVPVPDDTSKAYTMFTFGYFSYEDLQRGSFTGDDQLNFIVSRYDYAMSNDEYMFTFQVYDEQSNLVNTIASDVYMWQKLSDIEGQESQWAIMYSGDEEAIEMVNVPSCESVAYFPGSLNGEQLSTSFDRYLVGDSYQYVIAHGNGYDDGQGNTITRIGWYNTDTTLDHYVDINLGPNAIYAAHQFVTGSLNPYLFNTDDLHEYIMMANIQHDSGSTANETVLVIANDNGEVVRQFGTDDVKGTYNYGYLSNANANGQNNLVIAYAGTDGRYTLDVYPLPFSKFEGGGTGTVNDPYIITTAGDLDQIRNTPAAHYALGCDIDMSSFYGNFQPIDGFTGSLDGRGYSIDNLVIDGCEMNSGLFQGIYNTDNSISNLTLNYPVMNLTSGCINAGFIAGYVASAGGGFTIKNVHVVGGKIYGDDSSVGGLVGQLSVYSTVSDCSVSNIVIDVPGGSSVGGLVGETRTSSSVTASSASGEINANTSIGGIVGYGGTDISITNCYVDVALTGRYNIGGIVGKTARGTISNCYAKGEITVTGANFATGNGLHCAGGIVGYLDEDWSNEDLTLVVTNNLAALASISVSAEDEGAAVGRIVGYTAKYQIPTEDDPTVYVEHGLDGNYALATMTIDGATVTNTDDTTEDGADVAADVLTTDFFTNTLGFAFGEETAAPWKATESLPILYFEEASNDHSGIEDILDTNKPAANAIYSHSGTIYAPAAASIEVYSISGARMARVAGQAVGNVPAGMYVVTATDANGRRTVAKVIVK